MLTPNSIYEINGVRVNERIIPDNMVWTDSSKALAAGFTKGQAYKKRQKLCGTGAVKYITIHNTDDLANVYDDGEQYTRATYNENMGSTRVHFYVDDVCAWQNLKAGTGLCKNDPLHAAEVGWHAKDGSAPTGGNMTSIAIEIIMNDTPEHDKFAFDNGARIAAWLLWKNGLTLDQLVTHTYWINHRYGKTFDDVDTQCTNPIKNEKWCPAYIFASTIPETAKKNWLAFKKQVGQYLEELKGSNTQIDEQNEYHIGDTVQFIGKTHFSSSTAWAGLSCKPGAAKITAIANGAPHPYHVVHLDKQSTVYGWVNAADIM